MDFGLRISILLRHLADSDGEADFGLLSLDYPLPSSDFGLLTSSPEISIYTRYGKSDYTIFADHSQLMDIFTITAIALGLSFDTFAVSLSYGVIQNKILFRQAIKIALVFAIIQAALTVTGYYLGSVVIDLVKAADHWIALVLLSFLGMKMIIEGLKRTDEKEPKDYSKPFILLTAAVGTSIDAFAVGVSFAFLNFRIWFSGIVIGAVTFIASMTAIRIGKSAGEKLGGNVEIIGGLILIGIGIKIFLEHFLAS